MKGADRLWDVSSAGNEREPAEDVGWSFGEQVLGQRELCRVAVRSRAEQLRQ